MNTLIARGAKGGVFLFLGLLTAVLSCGKPFPEIAETWEFERTVLVEEATGTWCVNCPGAAENLEQLYEAYPDDVIVLAHHATTTQPFDPYANTETEARIERLGVSVFPTIVFDGIEKPTENSFSSMSQLFQDRYDRGAPVRIELTASLTADSVIYNVRLIVSGELEESLDATLRIALVEDHVDYTDEIWDGLDHVVRRLPETTGADELTLNPGDTLDVSRVLPLDAEWSFPLTAVVWLEGEDLTVYQAASSAISDEPGPINFSLEIEGDTIKTDTTGALVDYDFSIHNNTSGDLPVSIDIPESLTDFPDGNWFASLCSDKGCFPFVPVDTVISPDGSLSHWHISIGTLIAATGNQGSAVLEITAGDEVASQRFILMLD